MERQRWVWWLAAASVALAACGGSENAKICEIEELTDQLKNPFGMLQQGDDVVIAGVERLAKVGEDHVVTTLAPLGNGTGLVERDGAVYIIEYLQKAILRYDPKTWKATTFASLPAGGISLAVDGDDLIVTASDPTSPPPAMLRVKPDASVEVIADQDLGAPAGVIVDGDRYLVTDYFGGRLLQVTRAGVVSELATGLGNPVELRKYNGAYYVGDNAGGQGKGRLLKVTADGVVSVIATPDTLGNPSAMILRGDEMILTDDQHGRVLVLRGCMN